MRIKVTGGRAPMVHAMRMVAIAILCATAAAPASADAGTQTGKSCKAKVEKCISQCVRYNPKSVCTRFCQAGLVCG